MTVADLKQILSTHDDLEEVMYFDSEVGEDISMMSNWISFRKGKQNDNMVIERD